MRQIRWVALIATVVMVTAAASTVASAQGSGEKPTATEIGITDKEIRIAVVADVDNQFSGHAPPALTAGDRRPSAALS